MLRRLLLMSGGCFAIAFAGNSALAQITPDNTLGDQSQRSKVTPNINIKGSLADQIDGGASRGVNLFHSFSQFNINNGQQVYFANPVGIDNILTRVTGGNPSNIQGLLGVNGNANLFLINPNGIIFGQNAQLDIGGSFVASTANSIVFPNGYQFSATNPQAPPLLTINVPIGLQYGSQPGAIRVQQSTLEVPTGKTLMLVGGEVNLEGANLRAPGGRVELSGVGGAGNIGLNVDGNNLRLSPSRVARADVSLTNGAEVNVRSFSGGSIAINAQNLNLAGGSILQAGIESGGGSVNAQAGDIEINATGAITLKEASFIINWLQQNAIGKGGNITLNSRSLLLTDGSQIATLTDSNGQGGNLTVIASDSVTLSGTSTNGSTFSGLISLTNAAGTGGDLTIQTNRLIAEGGAAVFVATQANGQGGNLTVTASELLKLSGESQDGNFGSGLYAVTTSTGNAGKLTIANTGQLIIQNGAQVSAATTNKGKGADLNVSANSIEIIGVSPVSIYPSALNTKTQGDGDAGNLRIDTKRLIIRDGAQVATGTEPPVTNLGQAGNLTVNASEFVELIGFGTKANGPVPSLLSADTTTNGNGGTLTIETGKLIIRDGAAVSTTTAFGKGRSGDVIVKASDSVELIGTADNAPFRSALTTSSSGRGDAGNVSIETKKLIVRDGAAISTNTLGEGQAGNLSVKASESVEIIGTGSNVLLFLNDSIIKKLLSNLDSELLQSILSSDVIPSALTTETLGNKNAGNLTISTGRLIVRDGASISTATTGQGQGGNLTINASESVELIGTAPKDAFPSNILAASVIAGNAGNVTINTGKFIAQGGAQVEASTLSDGKAGTLSLNASKSVELIGTSANGEFASGLYFDTTSTGDAGQLRISTGQLVVRNGAQVSARTYGSGRGGILAVNAKNSVEVTGTSANGDASGLYFDSLDAGDARGISINTGKLEVQNGGQVTVSGSGSGTAGDLQITANSIFLNNQGTLQATNTSGAGSIKINTGELTVQNESQVTVSGTESGTSGDLQVIANSIFLTNQANLKAKTTSGEGGNIRLQVADTVLLRNNSNILTEALGTGNGGNITINAGNFVLAILPENSDIAATAIQGRGGNIFVTAQGVFGFSLPERLVRTPESDISAASQLGINGTREIKTRDVQPVPPLPKFAPPPLQQGCQVIGEEQTGNSFVITGRGGLPPNPSEPLRNQAIADNWVTKPSEVEKRSPPRQLEEAQGWVYNSQGQVVLTAQASSVTPYSPPQFIPKKCNAP